LVLRRYLKNDLPNIVEVHHNGHCARCGRMLTVPESLYTGFGPDCAQQIGVPYARL
jgi:hypothetical protein